MRVPSYVEVRWHRRSGGQDLIGTDISADGMFLRTEEMVVPGTLLDLRLQLPDGELAIFATVRFVGLTQAGQGIGVEFYTLSWDKRRIWLGFYRSLLEADAGAGTGRVPLPIVGVDEGDDDLVALPASEPHGS